MKSVLPAIKQVEWISAADLSVSTQGKIYEGIVLDSVTGTFSDLDIDGLASLSVQSEKQSGQDVYTTTLTLKKTEIIPITRIILALLARGQNCYRVTDIYGSQSLLGTPDKPYTSLTYKYDNADTPTGTRIFTVEIKYINLFSVLSIG
jgi:hypothetical protein